MQGLRAGAKGRAVRRETRWHSAKRGEATRRGGRDIRWDGARRHGAKGHKKGPTAGSGSGRRGIGREGHLTLRRSSAALASPLAAACER